MVSIGAVAVIAVGAFVYVLLSPAAQPPAQSSGRNSDGAATLTTRHRGHGRRPARRPRPPPSRSSSSRPDTSHGTVHLLGVAVAEGGMVVTTAGLLTDVRSIAMVGAGGKLEQASLVGTDTTSDIALVEVPEDLPVAPFADDAQPRRRHRRTWSSASPRRPAAPSWRCARRPARSPRSRRTSRPGPPTAWTPSCRRPR